MIKIKIAKEADTDVLALLGRVTYAESLQNLFTIIFVNLFSVRYP